jgi:metal-responsive CopG/Arc/MetJ family transcriptional regulator
MRTHVVLPRELIEEIDRIVGPRKRSRFIADAVRQKLLSERQREALRLAAGSLDVSKHPHWDTPEKTSAWVRASRQEDDARLSDKATDGSSPSGYRRAHRPAGRADEKYL